MTSNIWLAAMLALCLQACASRPAPLPAGHEQDLPFGAIADPNPNPPPVIALTQTRVDHLVLSGGGAYGAWNAGLLAGWQQRGDRPRFQVVTGISTGALVATVAFLGPKYDQALKQAYAEQPASAIVGHLNPFGALFGRSAYDSDKLRALIDHFITDGMIDEVAASHRQGRRLYVGTTNADAGVPVFWDLGAIAASDRSDRYHYYRDVLQAASAFPGAFEARYFPVGVAGSTYYQMHHDSAWDLLFLRPFMVDQFRLLPRAQQRVWVVVNHQLLFQRQHPSSGKALANGIQFAYDSNQYRVNESLLRVYRMAAAKQMGFCYAAIPQSYPLDFEPLQFGPENMLPLYRLGVDAGLSGDHWQSHPSRIAPSERMEIKLSCEETP
ncbi:patatin-like phospholipase family protein [Ferrimonas kyonanensis]|uniref:patatin-like phospholipase family protein n=1 Tax=Ferrimonas kyonanensis TaxID=364763 RepID=UPI00040AFE08|nr:patatin-like phospholipase family protein [Ferrimonas kyonanensis]